MWYVIQTTTGKEEELAGIVRRNVSHALYGSCFSMKRELLKRLGGRWTAVTETMFPSYVFLETEQPERLFYELKRLPEYTRLLGDNEGCFITIEKEEENLLNILRRNEKETCVAGLTTLDLDENGGIRKADGPLQFFLDKIVKLNLRKRFAVVELKVAGKEWRAIMGIRLLKDLNRI